LDLDSVRATSGAVTESVAVARLSNPQNSRLLSPSRSLDLFVKIREPYQLRALSVQRASARAMTSGMATELEKMLAGELYDALDAELVRRRELARDWCQELNASREAEQELRRALLQKLLGRGGDSAWIQPPFYCDYGSNIRLGERVYFNFNCVVLDVCEVQIGDFTQFGPAVQIYTATHPLNAAERRKKEFAKPVVIGSDVWVGGGALILPGVTIGSKSVIGAGSVVTRDIPSGVLAAGNPCRVLREISD
jgi:maltose O-acetyltransferase